MSAGSWILQQKWKIPSIHIHAWRGKAVATRRLEADIALEPSALSIVPTHVCQNLA